MNVGIDLGTTYSLVARVDHDGQAVLLPDQSEPDEFFTPSAVHIATDTAFVGRIVEVLLEQEPGLRVMRFFKRALGETAPLAYDSRGMAWHAEAVSALVLKKLRRDAEISCSGPVDRAVITVPAHFGDRQRKAVLAAASLADLDLLGIIEEPVAAALHYGVRQGADNQVTAVYDWGGGTFDVSLLSMNERGVYVLAKGGITDLGGKELDERIGAAVLQQFERALGAPIALTARTLLELRRVSEQLKIAVCSPTAQRVRRTVVLANQAVEVEISRAEFERDVADLVDRTESMLQQCITDAGLQRRDVDALLLVGGTSMMPAVAERLRRVFDGPHQQVRFHEPARAVACGAALHACQLAGEATRFQIPPELRGVSGHAIGVRTVDPQTGRVTIDTLIKRNMPLPVRAERVYYTTRADQDRVRLELVQFRDGEDDAQPLGQLVVGPLVSPRQNYPITVTVQNREDGTVAVLARDAQTGVELSQVFGHEADAPVASLAAQRALVRSVLINSA